MMFRVKSVVQEKVKPEEGAPGEGAPAVEKPTEEVEQLGTQSSQAPAGSASSETPDPAAKKPDEEARRYSELTARATKAEREAAEARERERLALEALSRMGQMPPKKEPEEETPQEPTAPEWTGDPQTYQEAMAKYASALSTFAASKATRAALAEEQAKRAKDDQNRSARAVQETWAKRRAEAIAKVPNYVEIAENPNLRITDIMAGAITTDVEGTAIALYLGNNVAEAERIAALPPGQQLVEIGLAKAKILADRTSRKVTTAPPPSGKPAGSGATSSVPLSDLPMDEYAAKRNESIAASRRSGGR